MISRKKIISRSQSDLDYNIYEEDVWYNKDKLYQVRKSKNNMYRESISYQCFTNVKNINCS